MGHSLITTISIGISLYPDHGADIDTILKNADSAMYQAKQAGRNQYQLYNNADKARGQAKQTGRDQYQFIKDLIDTNRRYPFKDFQLEGTIF